MGEITTKNEGGGFPWYIDIIYYIYIYIMYIWAYLYAPFICTIYFGGIKFDEQEKKLLAKNSKKRKPDSFLTPVISYDGNYEIF